MINKTDDKKTDDEKVTFNWKFDQYPVIGLPMCDRPLLRFPSFSWIIKALNNLQNIQANVMAYMNLSFYDEADKRESRSLNNRTVQLKKEYEDMESRALDSDDLLAKSANDKFLKLSGDFSNHILKLKNKGQRSAATDKAKIEKATEWGLEKYDSIFQNLPLPAVATHLRDDRNFAYWRVAGNNPVMLQRVSELPKKFPLKNSQYQEVMGFQDNLTKALTEGRVYMVDYVDLGDMVAEKGVYKPNIGLNYSFAPMALFVVPLGQKHLMPVAIQCGQNPQTSNMFLRSEKKDYYWGWQMAKYVVQVADETYHEVFTHLAYTHLISEVFAVATLRNFDDKHPLGKLLSSHFEGTEFINWGATVGLLREGQFIDTLFTSQLAGVYTETLEKRFSYHFYDRMLPNDLKRRGVDNSSVLGDYPYRDDALLVWNAISRWVDEYTSLYYEDDADVMSDFVLSKWVNDIIANGKIEGFIKIKSRSQLVDVLTMVIFTASAQHAAVNFTQPEWMRYAPATSGTSSMPAPYSRTGKQSIDYLDMLASYDQALQKFVIYSTLGGIYHGQLGQYENLRTESSLFDDERILAANGPLNRFRRELGLIEASIVLTNTTRYLDYDYLLPSRIPASTNI